MRDPDRATWLFPLAASLATAACTAMDLSHLGVDDAGPLEPARLTSSRDASLEATTEASPGEDGYRAAECVESPAAGPPAPPRPADDDCDGRVDACRVDGACASPDLLLHMPFEGSALDATPYRNDFATSARLGYAPGAVGDALALQRLSDARIDRSPSLDSSGNWTVELWVNPSSLPPAGERAGLIDDDGRYGVFVLSGGAVSCTVAGTTLRGGRLDVDAWSHVACTYDGSTVTVWQDGERVVEGVAASTLAPAGELPIVLGGNSPSGDRFEGRIDGLRVWSLAASASHLERAAQTRE